MAQGSRSFLGDDRGFFLIDKLLVRVKDAVVMAMLRTRQVALQCFALLNVLLLLLWIAAFLFGSFYYTNMPLASYSAPVHYHYRTDCDSLTAFPCSYPVANISLMENKKHVLSLGQSYQISLRLEMPDSPINQQLGMFMIRTTCFPSDEDQLTSSHSANQPQTVSTARFSMLKYRSGLLRTIGTLLFFPAFMTGVSEQKQVLEVELFADFVDNSYNPCVTAMLEIMNNKVQIYSSELQIHARFTGLRYLLFHFPLLSALAGVSSNFIFLSIIFILSYTRMIWNVPGRSSSQTRSLTSEPENNQREIVNRSSDAVEMPVPHPSNTNGEVTEQSE